MDDVLYKRSNLERVSDIQKLAPKTANAFFGFMNEAFSPGLIDARTKELIAVAITHVTGCPYCIDVHTKKFKGHGGTVEEILEAVMVAGVVNAESVILKSVNALNAFKGEASDSLYLKTYMDKFKEVKTALPKAVESFEVFNTDVLVSGNIDAKTKQLIAVAVAQVTGCAYSIEVHTQNYKKLGGEMEEILEAIMVAGVANAGYVLTHSVNSLTCFEKH
ncbi:carboxymuconolactone decarboxylase family protein [Peribacillus frigoritolerans]|nr:carboxymuconolactone decarboxylase family protein [Peribacillus frigoritolerans]